jgi:hypothetical protein
VIYQANLNLAREAAEKIDAAVLAVQALIDQEPQEYPSRPRITELRRISRELAKCETALDVLFQ